MSSGEIYLDENVGNQMQISRTLLTFVDNFGSAEYCTDIFD